MSGQPTKDVADLQHEAAAAREALTASLARLHHRVKHMTSTARDATVASGWGIAAAAAWWLSFAIDRPQSKPSVRLHGLGHNGRRSVAASVLTTALKGASLVLTGALMYASYRRARQLNAGPEARQLPR
jgi:hypothetical protein